MLRDFTLADASDVHAYASDIEVVRRFPFGPDTLKQTRAYLEHLVQLSRAEPRVCCDLAITHRKEGQVIGSCYLKIEGQPQPNGLSSRANE